MRHEDTVMPVRSQMRSTSEFIRSRVISSSAPNGSSISSSRRGEGEAARSRRLLHAAGQLVGVVLGELGQPDQLEHLAPVASRVALS